MSPPGLPEGPGPTDGEAGGGGAELRGVSAGYGGSEVVHNVTLEAPAGTVTVLTGPGGGGKTTLLRVLEGREAGGLWWRGRRRVPPGEVVFQGQLIDLEGERRRLAHLVEARGGPAGLRRELLRETHSGPASGLDEAAAFLARPPETWRRGEMQALRLLLTAGREASLYLIDEPEVDVSRPAMEWMVPRLRRLARRASVVVVTHHLKLVREIADRVAILDCGELLVAGDAVEIFERPGNARAGDFLRMGS